LQKMLLPPLNSDTGLVKTAQKALDKLKWDIFIGINR
jgi:hypothetical protein